MAVVCLNSTEDLMHLFVECAFLCICIALAQESCNATIFGWFFFQGGLGDLEGHFIAALDIYGVGLFR